MEFLLDRHSSADALKSFECGVTEMDHFIHHHLAEFLVDHKNQLFVVRNEDNVIVGMFVLSEGYFYDANDTFIDAPVYGKPFAVLDQQTNRTKIAKRYSTVEIEYLAVLETCRDQHIGTEIILAITDLAHSQHTPFITVDAYVTIHYSAVPFYEKCGFTHLENQDRGYDTVRMLLNIIPPKDN
jgi:GNAT superfamily N-acetyltransferase